MKKNTASRIHGLMSTWRSVATTDTAVSGWLRVLQITDTPKNRQYFLVNSRLILLIDELDLLREKLQLREVAPTIYTPSLTKLENAISPSNLHLKAEHVRQHLTEDVYTGLAFSSELLPEEEEAISAEDFKEIVSLINELELTLQESSFPSSLTSLIRKHIRLAELAIASYPIRGAVALKDAVKFAVGDIAFEGELFASAGQMNAGIIQRLWKKANDVADGAIKLDNVAQLGGRAIKLLNDLTG